MKINNGRTKRNAAGLAGLLFGVCALQVSGDALDIDLLERGSVHHSVAKGGRFELPQGPMIYQAVTDETFTKGYRPEKLSYLDGDMVREIYDLPAEVRSRGVFTDIVTNIEAAGFERLFQCEREACGESEAWRLYLVPLIGGSSETQYYYAGVSGGRSYISIYVNELGGQTRVLVDHITRTDSLKAEIIHGFAPAFDTGSVNLDNPSLASLRSLGGDMDPARTGKPLLLIGHSDSRGGLLRSLLLSGARAQAVRKALVESLDLDPQQISVAAFGYAESVSSTRRGMAGADRRVEIRSVEPQEPKVAAETGDSPSVN